MNWSDYVQKRFGFSDDTARARIAMWETGKPRLKKLADDARAGLSGIFDRPISSLTAGEFKVVQTVTHKLTDGKTVRMIQEELGLYKYDAPKPTGGHHPTPKLSLEDKEKFARLESNTVYKTIHRALWDAEHKHKGSIARLPDLSANLEEEMDLVHIEQAAINFLKLVQGEIITRGSQPTKYRL